MARPKTKDELISLSNKNFDKLTAFIDEMRQNAQFPVATLNRNIRDVLTHLYQWHLMMLGWYRASAKGEIPEMPAKGYTWKTTPELNKKIWKDY